MCAESIKCRRTSARHVRPDRREARAAASRFPLHDFRHLVQPAHQSQSRGKRGTSSGCLAEFHGSPHIQVSTRADNKAINIIRFPFHKSFVCARLHIHPPSQMSEEPNSKHTFHGSCHCGAIKYTASISLPPTPRATRCNCTVCLKSSFTSFRVASPDTNFKLLSPSSFSEIPDYQWASEDIHRNFCDKCGIQVFASGKYTFGGQTTEFFSINVLTLDQPQDGLDLRQWKFDYWDGKNNNWMSGKKDEPWPGGCV